MTAERMGPKVDLADYYTVEHAAIILGVSETRVGQLIRSGRLPGSIQWGRNWLILRRSLSDFNRLPPGRPRIPRQSL